MKKKLILCSAKATELFRPTIKNPKKLLFDLNFYLSFLVCIYIRL